MNHRGENERSEKKDKEEEDEDDEPVDTDTAIRIMFQKHIPDNQQALKESNINLEKIGAYCHDNYFQVSDKDQAYVLTKNYAQQALASVASQIFSYAGNIQTAMNLLENNIDSMDAQTRYIAARLRLHEEKRSRREIGLLTKPKRMPIGGQPPIVYPTDRSKLRASVSANRYLVHDSIDYTSLDNIGVAHKQRDKRNQPSSANRAAAAAMLGATKSATLRPSKSSNLSSIFPGDGPGGSSSTMVRPNTPPSAGPTGGSMMFGTLTRAQKDYHRSGGSHPLVVPPPQVPSDYASTQALAAMAVKQQPPRSEPTKEEDPGGEPSPPPPPPPPEPILASLAESSNSTTPINFIEKVVAVYDYTADKDDELSFQENSVIYVIRKNDDGWWEGVLNGITGLFPGNYVEPCL